MVAMKDSHGRARPDDTDQQWGGGTQVQALPGLEVVVAVLVCSSVVEHLPGVLRVLGSTQHWWWGREQWSRRWVGLVVARSLRGIPCVGWNGSSCYWEAFEV